MIKNYFKTAYRNLWKNKTFGFLNIVGLGIGITCAALIMLWVENEVTYNSSIPNKENIYQLLENQTYDTKIYTFSAQPGPLAAALTAEMPEIKEASRMYWPNEWLFTYGDKEIYEEGNFVDSSFFKLFSLHFIAGNPKTAFSEVHSVVISEKMANKFFGNTDAVGKTIKIENTKLAIPINGRKGQKHLAKTGSLGTNLTGELGHEEAGEELSRRGGARDSVAREAGARGSAAGSGRLRRRG